MMPNMPNAIERALLVMAEDEGASRALTRAEEWRAVVEDMLEVVSAKQRLGLGKIHRDLCLAIRKLLVLRGIRYVKGGK